MPPFFMESEHGHLHRHRDFGGSMDRVHELMRGLLLSLFAAFAMSAEAAWFFDDGYWRNDGSQTKHATDQAACEALAAMQNRTFHSWMNGPSPSHVPWNSGSVVRATHQRDCRTDSLPPSGFPAHTVSVLSMWIWCPESEVYLGNGVCGPMPPDHCTEMAGDPHIGYEWTGSSASAPDSFYVCEPISKCVVESRGKDMCFAYNGQWACTYRSATYTGHKCSGTETGDGRGPVPNVAQPPEDPPRRCPPGQVPGTVNGTSVCVPAGTQGPTDSNDSTSRTETSPDGSTTTTTTTNTRCEGGVCTTTTTTNITNNITHNTTSNTTSTTESLPSLCARQPQNAHCGGIRPGGDGEGDGEGENDPSNFGGSCIASFTCEGDAIQCAMAREQHVRNCQLVDIETTESAIGRSAASGELMPTGHPGADAEQSPFNLQGRIDTAPAFGGSNGCPSDVTVGEWQIRLSGLCPYLDVIRPAVIGFAWLVAAFVVFRRM